MKNQRWRVTPKWHTPCAHIGLRGATPITVFLNYRKEFFPMRKNKLAVSSLMFSGALIFGTGAAWPQSSGSDQPRAGQSGSSVGSGSSTMSEQMSQDQIKKIQQALKDKGHDPGPIDGNMNAQTQQALRAFQKSQNITVTGTLDSSTASALGVTPPSARGAGSSSSGTTGPSRDSSGLGSSTDAPNPGSSNRGSSGMSGSGSGSKSSGGTAGSGS
jgi:peptidoglycan hydrolase-like protein with peptidoglycan-binding domain